MWPDGAEAKHKGRNTPKDAPARSVRVPDAGRETGPLDGGDVLRLHALTPLGRLVGDLGALLEALVALSRDAVVMHEEVLASLVGGDEPVALIVAEPLDRSLGHVWSPPFCPGA